MPYLRDWIGVRAFINNFQDNVITNGCWWTDIYGVVHYYNGYNCYTSLNGYS